MAKKNGVLTIAAGPVYVEFQTKATFAPSSETHTELVPADKNGKDQEKWERQIGGSVWKMARHYAEAPESNGKFVLVSRFAEERAGKRDGPPNDAFVDDAYWLKESIQKEVPKLKGKLKSQNKRDDSGPQEGPLVPMEVVFKEASEDALTDYTFHMEHPSWQPWPVLTIRGGAARELSWQDVLDVWKDQHSDYRHSLVFLTGVMRTQLLETLAQNINKRDTVSLLNSAKLVIDFGRTARNVERSASESFREAVHECVPRADVVLADEHTADQYDLCLSKCFPKRRLLVRRVLYSPEDANDRYEIWRQFRKATDKEQIKHGSRAMYGYYDLKQNEKFIADKATKSGSKVSSDIDRPALDFIVARGLCLAERAFAPKRWIRYVHSQRPQTPRDITESVGLQEDLKRLETLIRKEAISTLLICGETGTGKEVISKWIYDIHPTFSSGNYHALSCGRQRGDLVQSELFGYVPGAFTGADTKKGREGAFVKADGGVLLLDDLDALDELTQAMLLRVVQDGLVQPVGGDSKRPVDLFLIVTTNVDPDELMRKRKSIAESNGLREDLYFRFLENGEVLRLPPLRDRQEDILPNATRIWDQQNRNLVQNFPFPKALKTALKNSHLVGNFRTLRAAVKKTFRAALTDQLEGEEIQKLPSEVVEWLDEQADDSTRQKGRPRQKAADGSQLLSWLNENDFLDKMAECCDLKEGVGNFLDLWIQARRSHADIESELTFKQIAACLETLTRKKSALRDWLKDFGITPTRTGAGAPWRPDWDSMEVTFGSPSIE